MTALFHFCACYIFLSLLSVRSTPCMVFLLIFLLNSICLHYFCAWQLSLISLNSVHVLCFMLFLCIPVLTSFLIPYVFYIISVYDISFISLSQFCAFHIISVDGIFDFLLILYVLYCFCACHHSSTPLLRFVCVILFLCMILLLFSLLSSMCFYVIYVHAISHIFDL
jgi:hypothetical protein